MQQPTIWTILKEVGESYYQVEVQRLLSLLEVNCVLDVKLENKRLSGIPEVTGYYQTLFLSVSKSDFRYRFIQLKSSNKSVANGTIGLLLTHQKNNKIISTLLFISLNDANKIVKIHIDQLDGYSYHYPLIPWGEGIPNYSDNDRLSEEEVFSYCFLSLFQFFNKQNYEILYFHNDKNAIPSFIVKNKKEKLVILLQTTTALAENDFLIIPSFPQHKLKTLIHQASINKATARVTKMLLESKDPIRRQAKLVLMGDDFEISSNALFPIQREYDGIRTYLVW